MLRHTLIIAIIAALAGFAAASPASAAQAGPLVLSIMNVTAKADLGLATFTYTLKATNRSESVGAQIFVHRAGASGTDEWPMVSPTDEKGAYTAIQLYKGLTATGTFTAKLSAGDYGAYRLLLFDAPDGHYPDFGKMVFDSSVNQKWPDGNLHLQVVTDQVRLTSPTIVVSQPQITDDHMGTYNVVVPGVVEVPAGYTGDTDGFWAMAKGSGGFSQVWAAMKDADAPSDPVDPYRTIPIVFQFKGVKPGIWNVSIGLFHANFGDPIEWQWPGLDFEVGGDAWVVKAPADSIPPRLHVRNRKFFTDDGAPYVFYPDQPSAMTVGFVRGGNYGNTIGYDIFPKLNTVGYFIDLHETGCRFMRVVFNPDRYPSEPLYQHVVDQVVQNIWAAGMYPILAPQDLPKGDSLAHRAAKGVAVVQALATKYRGQPVWVEVCNEPHEYGTWAEWKPVAERMASAVKIIDPGAFVIVPFEGWSKDGRGAAADPIASPAIDLYDGHAYVNAADVPTLFGSAGKAGLPVLIGEYGGPAAFMHQMDRAFQALGPSLTAIGPWAFTVDGQDKLPLIADGDTAVLKFTDAGQVIADDFARWNDGKRIPDEAAGGQ